MTERFTRRIELPAYVYLLQIDGWSNTSSQGNKEEVEKLKRELRFALEKAENAERSKGSELSSMLSKYNREMADLEEALRV